MRLMKPEDVQVAFELLDELTEAAEKAARRWGELVGGVPAFKCESVDIPWFDMDWVLFDIHLEDGSAPVRGKFPTSYLWADNWEQLLKETKP